MGAKQNLLFSWIEAVLASLVLEFSFCINFMNRFFFFIFNKKEAKIDVKIKKVKIFVSKILKKFVRIKKEKADKNKPIR